MGLPVLILGESGSGKSASLRNFAPNEVLIFNVVGKPLPFRKRLKTIENADYNKIGAELSKGKYKTYVIDDSQYLLANELFNRAKETGYGKFTDIAVRFKNMISYIAQSLPPDVTVYLLHHTEITDSGRIKAKTIGKMLDNQLTVEGLFTIVLLCRMDGDRHIFETQSDGLTTAKSPMEMFDVQIDNDLKMVDAKIREYYELTGEINNEQI